MKISVIIPAYNEEGNIEELFEKIDEGLSQFPTMEKEVCFIDDGSEDNTYKIAEELQKTKYQYIRIIKHRKNKGLSEALMSGFKNVTGDIIVYLCSDLQSNPLEDIPLLVNKILEGYDVVAGWRQGRRDGKNFVSKIYNKLSMKLFNISIHDNNWVKAFRREVIKKIHLRKGWYRYIVPIAAAEGFRITEIKLNWYPRKYGKSKFGAMRILPGVIDLLRVKFKINYLEEPMSLFGYSGLILTIVSGLLIVFVLFLKIFNLISTLLFIVFLIILFLLGILGVQILSIGFIGEMIAQINDKVIRIEEKIIENK